MHKLFVQKFISISQKKKRKKKIHYLSRYKLNQLLNQATDLFSLQQFFDSGKVTADNGSVLEHKRCTSGYLKHL